MADEEELLNAMNEQQLREKVLRLRQIRLTQINQIERLREMIENQNGDNGSELVRLLVDGLRSININVKPPRFEESQNHNQFIEKLENIFNLKNIANARCVNILDGAFNGRVSVWFDMQRNSCDDYDDFKTKFLAEFYSIPIRVRIKAE